MTGAEGRSFAQVLEDPGADDVVASVARWRAFHRA